MRSRHFLTVFLISLFTVLPAFGRRQIHLAPARTRSTGILHTERVVAGDFNNDGIPDLAISSTFNQVAIFLGKGDGSFSRPTIYNLVFYVSGRVVVADFNKDGKLDLAVVGGDTSGDGVAFLAGNGDGTFQTPVYSKTNLAGASITAVAADLNGDQNLDLFVGGNGSSEVLLGDGKGNFLDGQFEAVSGFGVALGDFNNDGKMDAVTTQAFPNNSNNGVSVLFGNGDGTFQSPNGYSGLNEPLGIATGDFNGDKKLDLAVTDYLNDSVVILQGNGDGTFTNIGPRGSGLAPGAIAVADFNRDGRADIAMTQFAGGGISVLTGAGNGFFPTNTFIATTGAPSDVVAVDLNGDDSPDLVSVDNSGNTFSVILNSAGTNVGLASSVNPSTVGATVTFTATVRGSVRVSSVPTGRITFWDGQQILGTAPLENGTATFPTSSLSRGSHNIKAIYSGNANFNPGRLAILHQKVN
jgi:hypothetical protein